MKNVIILGAGRIGAPMALDLAADPEFRVCAVDNNPEILKVFDTVPSIRTLVSDLSEPQNVKEAVRGYDLVVSAVPGFMGFETLRAAIEAGKDVVDIAFFPEDPFLLNPPAKERQVTAVVDCGVAPGMTNLLAGHVDRMFDKTETLTIYVGGLPEVREWPYEYKAGFSPLDVVEEYVRPARYVENGKVVVRPALSEPELVAFPEIGTLEAFNTDGLRTLLTTLDIPDMKEKTLRYPGHVEKIGVLRETGFFSDEEIEVKGARVRPRDVTARLLFPKWQLKPGDRDLTVLRMIVEGRRDGRNVRHVFEMLDRYDPATRVHSMARTTGYAATMMVRLLARGLYVERGVSPPEFIGRKAECVAFMLEGLRKRGVVYWETVSFPG